MKRKKLHRALVLILAVVLLTVFCGCSMEEARADEVLVWPDFVRYENGYYLFAGTYAERDEMGKKLGQVKINGPRENNFYDPDNLEAAVLDIGTELYEFRGESRNVIIAAGKENKIYRKIKREEFRHLVNGLSQSDHIRVQEADGGRITEEG